MNAITMTTITDALKGKQSWVVKGFKNFLETWKNITKDMDYDGPKKLYIHAEEIRSYGVQMQKKYFLQIGSDMLDYDLDCEMESETYPKITPSLVRSIMAEGLMEKVRKFFQRRRNDCDKYSETGQKIQELIDRLS